MTELGPTVLYLFDPALVESRLHRLPRVSCALGDPRSEGDAAVAFPKLRKTGREIFRIAGWADSYEHLDLLLAELDEVLAGGWKPRQLSTRSGSEFRSLLSEVHVARHFLARGFRLKPAVANGGKIPEFYASRGSSEIAIEVYRPRRWQQMETFRSDAIGLLLNADVPCDYRAEIVLRLAREFDDDHRLLCSHPDHFERGLGKHASAMLRLLDSRSSTVWPPPGGIVIDKPDVNLQCRIGFEQVSRSGDDCDRVITFSGGVTGYVPEAILERILRGVSAKARRRQAGTSGRERLRALMVDLSASPMEVHLGDSHRRQYYDDLVDMVLRPCVPNHYDAIVMRTPTWETGLSPRFIVAKDGRAREGVLGG